MPLHAPLSPAPQCALGLDMRNVERKGADQPLHPFIRVFRQGLGAALGRADLKEEMVRGWGAPSVGGAVCSVGRAVRLQG